MDVRNGAFAVSERLLRAFSRGRLWTTVNLRSVAYARQQQGEFSRRGTIGCKLLDGGEFSLALLELAGIEDGGCLVFIARFRIVEGKMQSPALLARQRRADY